MLQIDRHRGGQQWSGVGGGLHSQKRSVASQKSSENFGMLEMINVFYQ